MWTFRTVEEGETTTGSWTKFEAAGSATVYTSHKETSSIIPYCFFFVDEACHANIFVHFTQRYFVPRTPFPVADTFLPPLRPAAFLCQAAPSFLLHHDE